MAVQEGKNTYKCDICASTVEAFGMPRQWKQLTLAQSEGKKNTFVAIGETYDVCEDCCSGRTWQEVSENRRSVFQKMFAKLKGKSK